MEPTDEILSTRESFQGNDCRLVNSTNRTVSTKPRLCGSNGAAAFSSGIQIPDSKLGSPECLNISRDD